MLSSSPLLLTETLPLPLLPSDYIQDVISMLEGQELQYRLCFRKLLWYRPLNTDNPLYLDMLYQQVCITYYSGTLLYIRHYQE